MRGKIGKGALLVGAVAIALGCWVLTGSSDAVAAQAPVKAGKPQPSACCNPDNEPGVGGNPLCFEGHTCCDDGQWRCNNPDGSPSCTAGEVCAEGCGDRNDACEVDDDCCSSECKPNGRCK